MAGRRATAIIPALTIVLARATAGQLALHNVREAKEWARAIKEEARAAAFAEMQPSSGADDALSFALNAQRGLFRMPAAIEGQSLDGGIFFDSWTFGALPAEMRGKGSVRLPSLSLPGAEVLNMPFDKPIGLRHTLAGCQTLSGILGTGLLGRGTWQLDYPAGRLTRHPDGYALPAEATIPIDLDDRGGLRVALDLAETGRVSAALWLGSPFALVVSQDLFLAIGGRLPPDAPMLQGRLWEAPPLPKQQVWRIGFLPRLELGSLVLEQVPSLVDGASRDVFALGGRLFSGSRVTFNLATSRLHLESVEEPELGAWPGLDHGLVLGHDGIRPLITGVWTGSPAFKAGFGPGDRLISVNRRSFKTFDQGDFCAFLIAKWPNWGKDEKLTLSAERDGSYLSGVLPAWNALREARAAARDSEAIPSAQAGPDNHQGPAVPH